MNLYAVALGTCLAAGIMGVEHAPGAAPDPGVVASIAVPDAATALSHGRLVGVSAKQTTISLTLRTNDGEPYTRAVEVIVSPGTIWPTRPGVPQNVLRSGPHEGTIPVPYMLPSSLKGINSVRMDIRCAEGDHCGNFIASVEMPIAVASRLSLTLTPEASPADGVHTVTALARVYDQHGDALANCPVEFRVCLPHENQQRLITVLSDSTGVALLPLGPTTRPGRASLQVIAGSVASEVYRVNYLSSTH